MLHFRSKESDFWGELVGELDELSERQEVV
jgi:hypothetical protein